MARLGPQSFGFADGWDQADEGLTCNGWLGVRRAEQSGARGPRDGGSASESAFGTEHLPDNQEPSSVTSNEMSRAVFRVASAPLREHVCDGFLAQSVEVAGVYRPRVDGVAPDAPIGEVGCLRSRRAREAAFEVA